MTSLCVPPAAAARSPGPRRGPRGDLDSFAAFYSSDDLLEELPQLSQPEAEED